MCNYTIESCELCGGAALGGWYVKERDVGPGGQGTIKLCDPCSLRLPVAVPLYKDRARAEAAV